MNNERIDCENCKTNVEPAEDGKCPHCSKDFKIGTRNVQNAEAMKPHVSAELTYCFKCNLHTKSENGDCVFCGLSKQTTRDLIK